MTYRWAKTLGNVRKLLLSGPGGSVAIASSHGLRMLANLVILKLIATLLGATGLGQLGNAMSLSTIVSVFAGGGVSSGIPKYVAQYRSQPTKLVRFVGAATLYGMWFSGIVLAGSLLAARPLSQWLFSTPDYWWLPPILALLQTLAFAGVLAAGVVNGLGRSDIFAAITLPAYIVVIPTSLFLVKLFGLPGAAISLFLSVSCTGLSGLIFITRSRLFKLIRLRITREDVHKLSQFSLMIAASAASVPLGEILIRTQVTAAMGLQEAGRWQALIRLSAAYLGFFNIVLLTRYMPMLSAMTDRAAIARTVTTALKGVGGLFVVFAIMVFLARKLILTLLFSREFLPLASLMPIQLVGDGFRVLAYVIGFLAVAKGATRLYILSEVVQVALWVGLSSAAILIKPTLASTTVAYAIGYAVYFVIVASTALFYRKKQP